MKKTLISLISAAMFLTNSPCNSQSLYTEQDREYMQTIIDVRESSEARGYSLLVDKQARRAYLFKKGEIDTTFNVGLSIRPEGDKLYEGDEKTPEGFYKIKKEKDSSSRRRWSKYQLALLLDYPNSQDWKEFYEAKSKGLVPENVSSPGSNIEIHIGDDFRNWTLGCIAVSEKGMKVLMKRLDEGDSVGIIGYSPIKLEN